VSFNFIQPPVQKMSF